MCNPAIIVGLLTLATTAYSTHEANKQADAQADAIETQGAVNRAALEDKSVEITERANLEKFERKKQIQREVATTRASQSEGGVLFGNTALRTLATSLIGGGQDIAMIGKQEENLQKQIERQKVASSAGQAVQTAGIKWTSPLMAGLQAGTAGVGGYMQAGGTFG